MNRKLALIIGNSHYQDPNLAKLVAPTEDVNDLAEVLRDLNVGGFDAVNTLIDETDATIRLSIEDFFADKKPDDLLVLYFSGHGVRDEQGRLYLAAPNTRANRLRATAIATDFITSEMDRSRSKRQVLILDCCHSGAFAQGSKAVTGESAGIGPAFEGNGYGRVVLTATDATQYAWEGDKIIGSADNSLFTHYMVEGLRTGAADVDGDGKITLDEMYDYVYEQVVMQTPKQTPGKWSYKQQGDIVIARNPKPSVKPAELPVDLKTAIESPLANVRLGAVRELDRLLNGSNAGLVLAAFEAVKHLVEDDSRAVSSAAASVLQAYAEKQRAREDQARAAQEQAEQIRLANERAEAERVAALQAEADRQAASKAEQERQAVEKARQEQAAREAERAEQERLAKERAEADRQAAIKAEQDRLAAEKVERDRLAAERAEAERQAALRAEQERNAQAKAEAARQAAVKAEQDRGTAEPVGPSPLNEEFFDTARRAAVAAARLMVQGGPDVGQTFALQLGVNIIGRMSSLAIRLTDGLISRQHVRLTVEAGRVAAEDLGSVNGTFLNGQRLSGNTPVTLHDGDTLALGDTVLVFRSGAMVPAVSLEEPLAPPQTDTPTTIAEAPSRSFADQLVADQSTRSSSAGATQSSTALAAQLKTIAIPTLMATAGFGLIFAVWMASLMGVSDLTAGATLTIAAMLLLWGVTGLALRQMHILVAWQHVFAIGIGWAVAAGLGVGAAYILGSSLQYGDHSPEFASTLLIVSVFGAMCGISGGQVTGRILRSSVPMLNLKTTTLGWTMAWIVGPGAMLAVAWNSNDNEALRQALALCGALIGVIGGGTMFWQIASKNTVRQVAAVQQPIGSSSVTDDVTAAMRAIAIICGGWVAIELLVVLVSQTASSAADTATYISLSFGVGCLGLGGVLQRAVPSMRRTAWLLAGGWALTLIGTIQIGVIVQLESNWLSTVGVGICGAIAAWAVSHEVMNLPRWQYVMIGMIWMLAYTVGSGYAWYMVVYKAATHGWSLVETMHGENFTVFSLVLGAVLSALAGGVTLRQVILRPRHTRH